MNNVEIIKGIEETIKGLETIKKALMIESGAISEAPKSKSVAKKEQEQKESAEESAEENNAVGAVGKFSVEQLNSMKYNEFKKLASSLGVKCTGTRDEIMERILALDVVITEDSAEVVDPEDEEETAPTKSSKSTGSKKIGKKKADEPAKDEFDEQAEEIAKETDVEDIIESLADVDIKANKKNAVEKLAYALREGLIELDDEEDEDEDTTEEDTTEEETADNEDVEITADSYFPELDPNGYNDPSDMSDERAEAIEAKMDEILTSYEDGTLTDDDISSYVEDNATEEEIDLLGEEYDEEDILKLYMELIKRTIDNDGEEHEQGEPYEVADKDVCCGHELKYVKKTKKYVCSHCGTEYEAE